ncbi:hypothetical protein [Kitasatospora phosalacinea]|nr:hypothetical protein [Kitasatospora phosalacinea]
MPSIKDVDLDLGCMIRFSDGRKTVVQALGDSFGPVDRHASPRQPKDTDG